MSRKHGIDMMNNRPIEARLVKVLTGIEGVIVIRLFVTQFFELQW